MPQIIKLSPAPSIFGFGALAKLPEELGSRSFKKILVITDSHVAGSGILQKVLDLLEGPFDLDIFDEAPTEPQSHAIDKQKERFGADFDALLSVGGGSVMDFAKALSILMTHGGLLDDYVAEGSVPGPVLPVICVPTTSGTGSQSTQTTVFTTKGVKRGCSSEFIRPVFSVVDPELTMSLPPNITRNAGYDALMHAIESFLACPSPQVPERPILYQGSNPFSRGLAQEAFRLIWASHRKAVSDGKDKKARIDMSMGSHLAGIAFSHSGLGLVHALASSLGGLVDAPHGVCLAACTSIGFSYNMEACKENFAIMAGIIEGQGASSPTQASAQRFLQHIEKLIKELALPSKPSELGIKKNAAQTLLNNTLLQTRRTKTNPRPLDDELLSFIEKGI